jgi:hypothetical protein
VDVLAVRFAGATANFGWLAGGAIASAAWRRLAMAPPPGDAVTRASPRALRAHRAELLALSIPMLLGILVRIAPVAGAGFPVGDGGMFYVMVREIQQAGMTIPAATAYNHAGIPFAYPPLGLWLTALLGNLLPVPLLTIFQ